jgi:hypothetical protein
VAHWYDSKKMKLSASYGWKAVMWVNCIVIAPGYIITEMVGKLPVDV